MRFIGSIIEKLQRHPKRIVFPEGTEPRILQAARQYYSLRLGAPILLGDRPQIKEAAARLSISLEGVRIINPAESEDLDNFARRFEMLRRYKGIQVKEARDRDAQSELLRRDDGRDAPGGRVCLRRQRSQRQFAAAAVPNHQGRAASHHRLQLHDHGSGGHALRRDGRAVHGRLRRDSRAERGPAGGHCRCHRPVGPAAAGHPAARGVALLFDQGQRDASVDWQGAGRHGAGPTKGRTEIVGSGF